ncbi:MAG: hypothetical protein Q4C30_05220 [Bacteroidia bacterium]|nr:hypothetical protein [Bacteroidia bacterium]
MPFLQKILGILRGNNFRLYISFVVVASLFWVIEQLRRDYTTAIDIPLELHSAPENYIIPQESQENLSIRALVSGDGYTLLQHFWADHESHVVDVDVSRLPRVQTADGVFAVVVSSQFYSEVSSNLEDRIELRGMMQDSLFIPLLRARKKYLPVVPRVDYAIEQQHILSDDVRVSPSHVWVNGTNNLVDTMSAVYTKKTDHFVLHDTLTLSLDCDLPQGVQTNTHSVDVTFCVESFTEKVIEVPITAINEPEGYTFRAFPPTARVSFSVGISKFEKVGPNDIDIVADLSTVDIRSNNQQKVKLHLVSAPDYLMNISYSPIFVEFLLERQ